MAAPDLLEMWDPRERGQSLFQDLSSETTLTYTLHENFAKCTKRDLTVSSILQCHRLDVIIVLLVLFQSTRGRQMPESTQHLTGLGCTLSEMVRSQPYNVRDRAGTKLNIFVRETTDYC